MRGGKRPILTLSKESALKFQATILIAFSNIKKSLTRILSINCFLRIRKKKNHAADFFSYFFPFKIRKIYFLKEGGKKKKNVVSGADVISEKL